MKVTFVFDFSWNDRNYSATMTRTLPHVCVGMHLGGSQMMTVCQINWIPQSLDDAGDDYRAELEICEFGDISKVDLLRILGNGAVDSYVQLFDWKFELVKFDDVEKVATYTDLDSELNPKVPNV